MTAAHVYVVTHTDGVEHVWLPWANRPVCGSRSGLPGEVTAVVAEGDVPLADTCPDCLSALDERENRS